MSKVTYVDDSWPSGLREFGRRQDVQQKYIDQMYFAKSGARNIPWKFTYYSWCLKWFESGKWKERGTKSMQYCMCRRGDVGPYSYENTRIDTNKSNCVENYNINKPVINNKRKTTYNKVRCYYKYNNVLYTTINQLAEFNSVSPRSVNNWLNIGRVIRMEVPPKPSVVEKIVTPYGLFNNCTEAASAEPKPIRRQTLYHRLTNPKYPAYKKIKIIE